MPVHDDIQTILDRLPLFAIFREHVDQECIASLMAVPNLAPFSFPFVGAITRLTLQ